jgi:hypothetical protein
MDRAERRELPCILRNKRVLTLIRLGLGLYEPITYRSYYYLMCVLPVYKYRDVPK